MNTRRRLVILAALTLANTGSHAQAFPTKPIRIVVGMPPGSVSDLTARVVAAKLEQRLGQAVIVENRVGAGGSIAANAVARAVPDGYTLWYGTPTTLHPIYVKNSALILGKDLQPITNVFLTPYVFYASAKLPIASFRDLVNHAKGQPVGKLNFALITPTFELLMELLKHRTGITYTTIPYLGGVPASITALRAGEVDFAFGGLAAYPPHVQAGTLRALFITAAKRSSVFPDVPTAAEAGIADFVAASTAGLVAPMGTPSEVVQKLSTELGFVLRDAEVVDKFRDFGCEPLGTGPEAQIRTYDADIKLLGEAARLANFQPR